MCFLLSPTLPHRMMLGFMSSLLWNWLWRNEDTGWKELSSLLLCGWFIRSYLTSKQPKALTAIKPGGHYSLAFSTLPLPTTPIPAQCPLSPICITWHSFQPGHHSSFVLSGGCNKIEEEEEEEIESIVKAAQQTQPDPGTGPLKYLFVPDSVGTQVHQWTHESWFACHPDKSHPLPSEMAFLVVHHGYRYSHLCVHLHSACS